MDVVRYMIHKFNNYILFSDKNICTIEDYRHLCSKTIKLVKHELQRSKKSELFSWQYLWGRESQRGRARVAGLTFLSFYSQ